MQKKKTSSCRVCSMEGRHFERRGDDRWCMHFDFEMYTLFCNVCYRALFSILNGRVKDRGCHQISYADQSFMVMRRRTAFKTAMDHQPRPSSPSNLLRVSSTSDHIHRVELDKSHFIPKRVMNFRFTYLLKFTLIVKS